MDEKSLRDTYKLLWLGESRPLMEQLFLDLCQFAAEERDPAVRSGRAEVVMRLYTLGHEVWQP